MDNFPISFEDLLEPFTDQKGRRLRLRVYRLSNAIDYIWDNPNLPRALKYFHLRLAKFLMSINYNRLLDNRIVLKAQYLTRMDNLPEEDDSRETIFLDENRLDESFVKLEPILLGTVPPGQAGEMRRGMAAAIMTFFVVQLLREADRIDYSVGNLNFPVRFYARVDNALSVNVDLYARTVLPDRFRALQIMMDIEALNPDDRGKVQETADRLEDENIQQFVRKDCHMRLRIFELYQDVHPYIFGMRQLQQESSETRKDILRRLDRLLSRLGRLYESEEIRADRKIQIRNKIERRLARSIGLNNNDLGWHIYRGIRAGKGKQRCRSQYLFQGLLTTDADRLATLNLIYAAKKRQIGPSHPDYARAHEMFLAKYQPFFTREIVLDAQQDAFTFAEKDIELDLGTS